MVPESTFEVSVFRAAWKKNLIAKTTEYHSTFAGWFSDSHLVIEHVLRTRELSLYCIPNPLTIDFLATDNANKLAKSRSRTKDEQVLRLRWWYIDTEAVGRLSDVSGTDDELKLGLDLRDKIILGSPGLATRSMWGCSGNGGWILVALPDYPNDDYHRELVHRANVTLGLMVNTPTAHVDPKTFNPARLMPLPGTLKCKGTSTHDRPWRPVTIDSPEGDFEVLDLEAWLSSCEVHPAVQVPIDLAPADPGQPAETAPVDPDAPVLVERILRYLDQFNPAISGHQGHDQTFDVACALVQGFALTPTQAWPYIDRWNASCDPPWEKKDLWHKLQDAKTKVNQGKPRGYLVHPDGVPEPSTNGVCHEPAAQSSTGSKATSTPAPGTEDNPHRLARVFLAKRGHPDHLTIVNYGGAWLVWEGASWRTCEDKELRARVVNSIELEFRAIFNAQLQAHAAVLAAQATAGAATDGKAAGKSPVPLKVTTRLVGDVMQALSGLTLLDSVKITLPSWLKAIRPWEASEMLATQTQLLHLPSLAAGLPPEESIVPATPAFFSLSSLEFSYDPEAPRPVTWLTFLGAEPLRDDVPIQYQLWPEDSQAIELLQEWFGLCLTVDTSFQKMLAMIGPKRSGKGTITRILSRLIGESNVAGPTLNDLANDRFALEGLIGRPLMVIDDARITRMTDTGLIAERLLSISGEARLTVPRKFLSAWHGRLPTRVILQSNELPRIADASGALAGRFLLLNMERSFFGHEDRTLDLKLKPELPGILNWAIEGWRRLQDRGRFAEPETSAGLVEEFTELASPISIFAADCLVIGPDEEDSATNLYQAWVAWCVATGRKNTGDVSSFGRDLRSIVRTIRTVQVRRGGRRERFLHGVSLIPAEGYMNEAGEWTAF